MEGAAQPAEGAAVAEGAAAEGSAEQEYAAAFEFIMTGRPWPRNLAGAQLVVQSHSEKKARMAVQSSLGKRPSSEADHEDAPGREERLRLVREADIQKRLVDLYREQLEKERSLALQERDQAQCVLEHVQKELKDADDKLKDAHVLCAGAQFASNEWRRLCSEAQKERDELQKSLWQMRGRSLYDLPDAQLESLLEDIMVAKERVEKMQLRRAAEACVLAKHPDYACPISLAIMRDPVVTDDGQSYERTEIEAWFKSQREANEPLTSPLRAPLKSAQLVPNHSLRRAIEAAVEAELRTELGAFSIGT